MPTIKETYTSEIIDRETNKVIRSITNQKKSYGEEPSYVKLYLRDVLYLSDIPKKHNKILYELLKRSTYAGDGMEVCLSAGLKRIMMKSLGYKSVQPIDNALCDLTKGKILYRIETGVYKFNPYLFGKGDWQDISNLRLEINYDDIKGKTFKTVCEYDNNSNIVEANFDTAEQVEFNTPEEFDEYIKGAM